MDKKITLTKAQNAEIARDFQTAVRLYKELLRDEPDNLEYLSAIGSNYVKANEDEKALPFYQKIIDLFPHSISAMNSMGGIYRRLKRYDESVEILKKALEENKEPGTLNYTLGFTYREMGKFDEGIECFEIVVNENPNDVLAYNHLGSIYAAKEDFEKAILSYKKGLQIDQNHPILNYNIAHSYESLGQYPDAIRSYEAALRTRPGWAEAIHDFSDLLLRCDKTKEAQNLVMRSIKLYPNDSKMLCILGYIFLTQYDFDAAEKSFKKAKKINPEDVSILSGLTEALEKGEKIEEALQTIEEALYLDPENLSLQKQEISTLLSSNEYEEAFKKIDTLCKLNEDDVQLLDLYSQYYACMNDVESTNYYHNKIAKIDKNYKKHILSAAKRFSQIGEIDHAEQFAKAYIEKTNNDPEGYNTLGKLYSKSGDVDKAIVSYNKGLKLNKDNVYAGKQIAELLKSKIVNEPEEPSPIPVAEPESIPAEPNESFEVPTEEADFDFDSMGQNEKMMELPTSSEDEFWGGLGTEFEDSSEADKIELPKKEPEIVGMEELADEESVKSLGDLAPELEPEQSQGLPIEDDFDFDSFGFADDSEGEEIQGLSPIYESAEESPVEDFAEESSVVAGGGELETNQISENKTLSSDTASLANQDEMIGNLKEKLQESIINSANLAVETAMNAQKMAQQVADEQSKISELQKALEEKQIETEQMQEELVMQQIKAEQLQQQLLEKQYEAENSVQQEPELESEPVIEQVSEPEIESQQEGLELVDNFDLLMNSEMNLEPIQSETTENSETESEIKTETESEIDAETESEIKNEVGESTSQEYSDSESVEEKINFDGAVFEEDLLDLGLDEEPTEALPEESFEEVVEQSFELPEEAPVEETSEVKIEESEKETAEEELEELDNVEFTPIESEEDEITSQQMFYLVNDNIIPDVDEIIEDEKSLEIDDLIFDILIGEYEFPTVDAILADMLLKLSDEEIHIIKQFQAEKKSSDFEKRLASDALVTEDEFAEVFEEESVIEEGAELYEENDEVFVNEEVSEQEYEETVEVQEIVNEDVVEQESQDVSELQQMFQKIESVLKDEDICQKYKSELEMFKKLKLLMDFIPQELSDSVNTNKLRVQIEYIIAKISGKPGLLKTVSSLIESGYFGEESEAEFQSLSQEELSQDQIKSVLEYAKKLALNLEDSVLSDSLCEVAEEIIQKI